MTKNFENSEYQGNFHYSAPFPMYPSYMVPQQQKEEKGNSWNKKKI